ncbi:H-NS histone family protein [Paucibacter soli]|uniref:H-NS histone family protein n=1 Tax=Paucibacter soli TaxID=3133433 RepID=UPI0030A174FC
MAKAALSPLQIERQIATLQARLAQARKGAGKVIARIKKDVAKFGITAEDIFGTAKDAVTAVSTLPAPVKAKVPAKYTDGANTWSGRGAQPRWIRAAVAEGKKIEDFLIGAAKKVTKAIKAKSAPAEKSTPKATKKAVKMAAPVKMAAAAKPAVKTVAPVKKAAATKPAVKMATPVKKAAATKPTTKKPAAAPAAATKASAPKKAVVKKVAPKPVAKKASAKPKQAAPTNAPSAPTAPTASSPQTAPAADKA